ncbi:hypothetical protein DICVIV_06231 [Dictyocaulus viviparus]|uniref:Uncharacterized protein n=1 Tax=Dictyocaulus viviparus TaxID=29172 RepID=A0A0D8XV52_DICVI|nr:hypothetical protein DICVIV_06231 [Dictyocaulus viviparus]
MFICWTKMTLPSAVPRRRVPHTTNDCVQLRTVCRLIKSWQLLCVILGAARFYRKCRMISLTYYRLINYFRLCRQTERIATRLGSGLAGGTVIWQRPQCATIGRIDTDTVANFFSALYAQNAYRNHHPAPHCHVKCGARSIVEGCSSVLYVDGGTITSQMLSGLSVIFICCTEMKLSYAVLRREVSASAYHYPTARTLTVPQIPYTKSEVCSAACILKRKVGLPRFIPITKRVNIGVRS